MKASGKPHYRFKGGRWRAEIMGLDVPAENLRWPSQNKNIAVVNESPDGCQEWRILDLKIVEEKPLDGWWKRLFSPWGSMT